MLAAGGGRKRLLSVFALCLQAFYRALSGLGLTETPQSQGVALGCRISAFQAGEEGGGFALAQAAVIAAAWEGRGAEVGMVAARRGTYGKRPWFSLFSPNLLCYTFSLPPLWEIRRRRMIHEILRPRRADGGAGQ